MNNIKDNNKYNLILSILILSLFVHFRYETAIGIIRPFDLLCIIIFSFVILNKNLEENKINLGFLTLYPFF